MRAIPDALFAESDVRRCYSTWHRPKYNALQQGPLSDLLKRMTAHSD
ncbi:hypothetical protein [Marinobacterium aestuarii]|nr:hypothetical protein [Marinobacterium aestuarii]